jgi:hypothetical protein
MMARLVFHTRPQRERGSTLEFMRQQACDSTMPYSHCRSGERILPNDVKPRGLHTAVTINLARDEGLTGITFERAD